MNTLKTFGAFVLAAVAITGCSKEHAEKTSGPVAVNFSAGIGQAATPASAPVSRASGTDWALNDEVGIYMLVNGGTTVLADNKNYVVTDISTGALTAVSGSEIYYPQDGSAVNFIGYYPWKANGPSGIVGNIYAVNVSDQANPADIDLLWAKATGTANAGYTKIRTDVNLEFEHKLTKLIIKTEAAPGVGNLAGMDVKIRDMYTENEFDLLTGSLGTAKTPADITPVAALDGKQYEAIILPRRVDTTGDVSVLFTVGLDPYVWNIPAGTVFAGGEEQTWTVTLTPTEVTATGSIKPWITKPQSDPQTAE